MKDLAKTTAIALAAAGISNAVAGPSLYPDRATERTAGVSQVIASTGLSFEDLRVGSMGKVQVEIGPTDAPVWVAEDSDCRK